MNHFFKFLSLVSFLILFSGCYTYQMSSWNDDDGIYVSSIRNYNYGQYFSDLANEIIEEYEDSGIADSEDPDNLPWGYKPDQTQIFIDFYPRYSGYGYPYSYGSLYGYGYPYGYGYTHILIIITGAETFITHIILMDIMVMDTGILKATNTGLTGID